MMNAQSKFGGFEMKKILTQFSGDLKTAAILGIVVFTISIVHGLVVGFTVTDFVWAVGGGAASFVVMAIVNTLPIKAGVGVIFVVGLALYMLGSFDRFGTFDDVKVAVKTPASTVINGDTSVAPIVELNDDAAPRF